MAKNKHILIGQLGEDIICKYLKNRGFRILERNFRKKWGEIDIVASKKNVRHFVEVKTGACKAPFPKEGVERYRPEDHVDFHKKKRLRRIIETYLYEKDIGQNAEWTIDIAIVLIDVEQKKSRVCILENETLE